MYAIGAPTCARWNNKSRGSPTLRCGPTIRRLLPAANATHSKVRGTTGRCRSIAGNSFGSFPLARRLRRPIKIPSGVRSRPRTRIPGYLCSPFDCGCICVFKLQNQYYESRFTMQVAVNTLQSHDNCNIRMRNAVTRSASWRENSVALSGRQTNLHRTGNNSSPC